MNKNKIINSKIILILALILSFVMLSGAGLAKNKPKVNAETDVLYDFCEAEALSEILAKGYSYAEDMCRNKAVCVNGVVKATDSKSHIITVASIDNAQSTFDVSCKDKNEFAKIKINDQVTVYGIVSKKSLVDNTPVVEANRIAIGTFNQKADYVFAGGNFYDKTSGISRSIADGKIRYSIPERWQDIEGLDEDKSQFFNINLSDGNCYYLNALKGKETAECFCIFYFSSDKYLKYDTDKSELSGIERAIISNICPSEKSKLSYKSLNHYTFPTDSVTTSYGLEYDAYVASYKTHRAEFIFTPAKDGVCVMLYVYNDDYSSSDDILYLMRTLEIVK